MMQKPIGLNSNQNKLLFKRLRNCFEQKLFTNDFDGLKEELLMRLKSNENNVLAFNHIHPLGFLTLKVAEYESGETLKVHIWSDNKRPYKSKLVIHKHNTDLVSYILKGKIKNIEYDFIPEQNGLIASLTCALDSKGNRCLAKTRERGKVALISNKDYREGEHYKIKGNYFHESIINRNDFTATLIYCSQKVDPIVLAPFNCRNKIYNTEQRERISFILRELDKI